ncbi:MULTISPECIES: class I SAM-dependent DNA methyltransferase [unclassified Neisseria]|uniref:type I restriction-modification system subunit M n=1 Tax=unclassified Neisseria TaxID=2623750 RepID=UPI0010726D81|nr:MULTISPECIES: class I SAM-dependent DNA methyltransferase [unclassified Neisseria]MBF0802975.1 SAM-dependent DNA methyltransferase [Neisseria sp. 19428wB4_WF04]TFU44501.1 SAM-dependent DNA methyltransferase [Neisseria sp. WF04]
MARTQTKTAAPQAIETVLWAAANKLRNNIDAAEYKHIVLGLIFLKYISDSFETKYRQLQQEEYADPEDRDEYLADNIFFVPENARWQQLVKSAKQADIGVLVDQAMENIEHDNAQLKGVLPKVYARQNLDPIKLGELIDEVHKIDLGHTAGRSSDILGHVFEYFLGEFALAEGKQGGQFYTPKSIVKLLVNMIEPYQGRVFDPCCGSGGMFVQSEAFIEAHQGRIDNISIYGQESNQTTWRLCKMNLAIRGINAEHVYWNSEGSFLNDAHQDLKADFILANPPFNVSDWWNEKLAGDARWRYGTPPAGNANFAWLQHFLHHLAPQGQAGVVLAKGALTSKTGGEGGIRKALVDDANVIDCIVNLPAKLFLNTQIPAALWFMRKDRADTRRYRDRSEEVLFIDVRNMGQLINRKNKILTDDDIAKISGTYHNWRNKDGAYQDIAGFCASVPRGKIAELDYVLTPGRYVGLPEEEDEFNFAERFAALQNELNAQLAEETRLNAQIAGQLAKIKLNEVAE